MKGHPGYGAFHVNAKGKKSGLMGCGCCAWVNLKDKERDGRHKREMKQDHKEDMPLELSVRPYTGHLGFLVG